MRQQDRSVSEKDSTSARAKGAGRTGFGWSRGATLSRATVAGLQRSAGNTTVARLLAGQGVQRVVGWADAKGANAGAEPKADGTKMSRIPLEGLKNQNQSDAPDKAKTTEAAAGKAVVWMHPDLNPEQPVTVLLHLHGLTSRDGDPFAGYRENDVGPEPYVEPKSAAARKTKSERDKKATYERRVADQGQVRDVARDRIGRQVEGGGNAQTIAVLPQGTGVSGTPMFGKDFDADAMVSEIFARLQSEKLLKAQPATFTIILSAHSAGGATVAGALNKAAGKGTGMSHVGGLLLLDAIYSKDGSSWQRPAVLNWIGRNCRALGKILRDKDLGEEKKAAAIAAIPGLRGFWESGYKDAYEGLQKDINKLVNASIPTPYRAAVGDRFLVTKLEKTSHDQMVGGNADRPVQDSLRTSGKWVAQRSPAPAPAPAPVVAKTGTVKISWVGDLKNAAQLQPVLDKNPADPAADIVAKKKTLATANSSATLELPPGKHVLRVVPTAKAPADYFRAGKATVVVKPGESVTVVVTLGFNRENARFTERTWEVEGLDITKVNDVTSATLFGVRVIGGLNKLTNAKVAAANAWFDDDKNVTPADREVARASLISVVGQVKRAQSRGTYSNHSTGVAIDINPNEETLQNAHLKKSTGSHAKAVSVFNTVVSQAKATTAGGKVDEFKDFDLWKTKDRDKQLAASARFNALFPDYLLGLVTAADTAPAATVAKPADGKPAEAPTAASVMTLTAAELKALAKKATAAKKPDVAAALEKIATNWTAIRAWVGGYVYTDKKHRKGMLRADFEAAKAKDKKLQSYGELTGMISLHPAVVKALTEGGWSWLVDYKHNNEKDFMHFEDRQAQKDLKAAPPPAKAAPK